MYATNYYDTPRDIRRAPVCTDGTGNTLLVQVAVLLRKSNRRRHSHHATRVDRRLHADIGCVAPKGIATLGSKLEKLVKVPKVEGPSGGPFLVAR